MVPVTMTKDLFDQLFTTNRCAPSREGVANRGWVPAIDVYEDAESLQFHVELPGLKPEEIDVELKGDTLTIKGERKFENEEKKSGYVRVERAYGKFQRSFTLGVPINADGLKATCKNGVLEVIVPKAEAIKPKKALVTAE